jgi:uncharacterized Fe-S cluster-containing radical SAM superfamily protein
MGDVRASLRSPSCRTPSITMRGLGAIVPSCPVTWAHRCSSAFTAGTPNQLITSTRRTAVAHPREVVRGSSRSAVGDLVRVQGAVDVLAEVLVEAAALLAASCPLAATNGLARGIAASYIAIADPYPRVPRTRNGMRIKRNKGISKTVMWKCPQSP